jgi:secreted trypsin-like serine protease
MRPSLIAAGLALAFAANTASAITWGNADGDRHPQVGALVAQFQSGEYAYCTGTLISPTVFLTAAHCDLGTARVTVTFDSAWQAGGTLHAGTYIASPEYSPRQNDPQDLAVVVFDQPVAGITPARLPTLGQFEAVARDQAFTAVGYGGQEREIAAGGPVIAYTDVREFSVSAFNARGPGYLRLSQNQALGNGGTCYGDSGGPNFLGAGADETTVIAGTTITGDAQCVQSNVIQRLDTERSRAFLGRFVTLP